MAGNRSDTWIQQITNNYMNKYKIDWGLYIGTALIVGVLNMMLFSSDNTVMAVIGSGILVTMFVHGISEHAYKKGLRDR